LHEKKYKFHVQGGLHSVAAAKKWAEKAARKEVAKELVDSRWTIFPCRLYLFEENVEEVAEIVSVLGQEDNEGYKMVQIVIFIEFVADCILRNVPQSTNYVFG